MKVLPVMLKNVLTRQIMMKKTFPVGKNKKVIGMTKDETSGKMTAKFAATKPKNMVIKYKKIIMK